MAFYKCYNDYKTNIRLEDWQDTLPIFEIIKVRGDK
jgi:hypothetical protein